MATDARTPPPATDPPSGRPPARRPRVSRSDRREWLTGYLFVLPATLVICVFGLFPILYALYMSVHRWRVAKGGFVGLANFERILGSWGGAGAFLAGLLVILVAHWLWSDAFRGRSPGALRVGKALAALVLLGAGIAVATGWGMMVEAGDRRFLRGLMRTFWYGFLSVPVQIALALAIASLLFQKLRGQEAFRMLFFLPYVTPAVAAAVVFRSIFSQRETSLANQVWTFFGGEPLRWLFEPNPVTEVFLGRWLERAGIELSPFWAGPSLALVTIILFGIWTYTGYNAVIFLAGLGNIPRNLYEAAEIDGAGRLQQFLHITVPLLSPVTFYLTVLGFIGTFQAFTHLYVMRDPFVRDAVDTASIVIFDTFYARTQYGVAAAQSIVLFVIILILTLLQNRLFGRRALRG